MEAAPIGWCARRAHILVGERPISTRQRKGVAEDKDAHHEVKSEESRIAGVKRPPAGQNSGLTNLSKYCDTLNHELLMNLIRKNVHDKRIIEL